MFGGRRMVTAKKHFTRPHHKGQASVPDTLTADELQEVITQALWEWGVSKGLMSRTATHMPENVLASAFRLMTMGGKSMDAGKNKATGWLTSQARDWHMENSTGTSSKLSKNQFSDGLHAILNVRVQWANVDSLWRRVLKDYPPEPGMPAPSDFKNFLTASDSSTPKGIGSGKPKLFQQPPTGSETQRRPVSAGGASTSDPRRGGGSSRPFRWNPTSRAASVHPSSDNGQPNGPRAGPEEEDDDEKDVEEGEEEGFEDHRVANSGSVNSGSLLFGSNWRGKISKLQKRQRNHLHARGAARSSPTHHRARQSGSGGGGSRAREGFGGGGGGGVGGARAVYSRETGSGGGVGGVPLSARPKSAPHSSSSSRRHPNPPMPLYARSPVPASPKPPFTGGAATHNPRLVPALGVAGKRAAEVEAEKAALLKAAALSSASHITMHQFVLAFTPPHNDAHAQVADQDKADRKAVATHMGGSASASAAGASVSASGVAGGGGWGGGGGTTTTTTKKKPLTLHARGGSTEWMNDAFGRVMAAMDRDDLLLHEAFFVFDQNGDGVVSLGEFVRTLRRMQPPLNADKNQMFSLFTVIDPSGGAQKRHVRLPDFVAFFLTLYQQRLDSLETALKALNRDLRAIDLELQRAHAERSQLLLTAQEEEEEEAAAAARTAAVEGEKKAVAAAATQCMASSTAPKMRAGGGGGDEEGRRGGRGGVDDGDGRLVPLPGASSSSHQHQQQQEDQQQQQQPKLSREQQRHLWALEDVLSALEKDHREVLTAMGEVKVHLKRTSVVVAAASDQLANEEAARREEAVTGVSHGGAGLSQYTPATGKGGIAQDFYHHTQLVKRFRMQAEKKKRDEKRKKMREDDMVAVDEVAAMWEQEEVTEQEEEKRHERERRTRRINEMLCFRIYKRNQILPIKQQVLGATYSTDGDSMQPAVATGKFQLKVEIQHRLDEQDALEEKLLLKESGEEATGFGGGGASWAMSNKKENKKNKKKWSKSKSNSSGSEKEEEEEWGADGRGSPNFPSHRLVRRRSFSRKSAEARATAAVLGGSSAAPAALPPSSTHHREHGGSASPTRKSSSGGGGGALESNQAAVEAMGAKGALLLLRKPALYKDTAKDLLEMGTAATTAAVGSGEAGEASAEEMGVVRTEEDVIDLYVVDRALQATAEAKDRAVTFSPPPPSHDLFGATTEAADIESGAQGNQRKQRRGATESKALAAATASASSVAALEGALAVPGPFANVIRKVGLGRDAVRREMVVLHMQEADSEFELEMREAEQRERHERFEAEVAEHRRLVSEARKKLKAEKATLKDPGVQLKRLFHAVDADNDGSLTRIELKTALNNFKTEQGRELRLLLCDALGIPDLIDDRQARETFEVVFDCLDHDKTHTIDLEEMTRFVKDVQKVAAMYAADFGVLHKRRVKEARKQRKLAAKRHRKEEVRAAAAANGYFLDVADDDDGGQEGEGSADDVDEGGEGGAVKTLHPNIRHFLAMADVDRSGTLDSAEVIRSMRLHPEIREFLRESERQAEEVAMNFLAAHELTDGSDDDDEEEEVGDKNDYDDEHGMEEEGQAKETEEQEEEARAGERAGKGKLEELGDPITSPQANYVATTRAETFAVAQTPTGLLGGGGESGGDEEDHDLGSGSAQFDTYQDDNDYENED